MDKIVATKVVQRPDGTEHLVFQKARIVVKRGPDKGKQLVVDRPRVRIGTAPDCDLQLTDEAVSRYHIELRATERGYLLRDLGSTNGTRVGELRLLEAVVTGPVVLELGQTRLQVSTSSTEVVEIPLSSRGSFGGLLGQSRQIRQVFAILERIAPTRSTVLLEGESGTGKEVAAHAIHKASGREGPFVVVDCGAIPANLIESELFGHEKGAFTGADRARTGALAHADGGTLFLDEVGELPVELQPRLLRFLESQEVKPIGSSSHEPRVVDVRVVAATNRNLSVEVDEGRFRQDLYYRLSVVAVELPPLRERPEDILLLARHFAEALQKDPREVISSAVAGLLLAYAWPGNVRELRNVIERVSVLPELAARQLHRSAETSPAPAPTIGALVEQSFHEGRSRWQDIFERQYLTAQMARNNQVVKAAAKSADLPRQTFHRLLRKHGLKES
jgi:transcriptional regulator with GAF, ATPase, and Fis domain